MISVGSVVQIYSGPPAFASLGASLDSEASAGQAESVTRNQDAAKAVPPKLPKAAEADGRLDGSGNLKERGYCVIPSAR